MNLRRPLLLIVLFVLNGIPTFAQSGQAVVASFKNISHMCTSPTTIQVQFLSGEMSTRITVPPKAVKKAGLFEGWYLMATSTLDGAPVEKTMVIPEPGCEIPVGCSYYMPTKHPEAVQFTRLTVFNTTKDCGEPRKLLISINGKILGDVQKGQKTFVVPKGNILVEVIQGNQRLLVTCLNTEQTTRLFYGCTNPLFKGAKDGVNVLLNNSTDKCGGKFSSYLTFWMDTVPLKGLAPGKHEVIQISKGQHRFKITRGLTGPTLLDRVIDCKKPFMLNYGCSTKK